MAFGKEIKRLREKASLTSAQMAAVIGIDNVERYRNWEKRDSEPKYEDVTKFEQFFELQLTEITQLDSIPKEILTKIEQSLKEIKKESEEADGSNSDIKDSYHKRRQIKKLEDNESGIIYVPVAAQAGYSKRMNEPKFDADFERVYLPGLKFKGARYRIFEVDGDSMSSTLKDGNQVIAELVEPEGYETIANYYIYVIVSEDMITIKRVFRKSPEEWVLISDNDEFYDQFLFEVKNVKELWKVKRKIDWEMAPPKKFEIKL